MSSSQKLLLKRNNKLSCSPISIQIVHLQSKHFTSSCSHYLTTQSRLTLCCCSARRRSQCCGSVTDEGHCARVERACDLANWPSHLTHFYSMFILIYLTLDTYSLSYSAISQLFQLSYPPYQAYSPSQHLNPWFNIWKTRDFFFGIYIARIHNARKLTLTFHHLTLSYLNTSSFST